MKGYEIGDSTNAAIGTVRNVFIVLFLLAFVWLFFVASVPAGSVGIVDTFGNVDANVRQPGLQFKLPWQGIIPMSIKTQQAEEKADTPSKEGLTMNLDVSIIYHLEPEKAVEIYKTVGPNYQDTVLIPNLRGEIRGITADYDAKSLYTADRALIARQIQAGLEPQLKPRGIIVESIILRGVALPEQLKSSIEAKLQAEQEAQQMEFVLQKASKEADRKVIEAHGIANAQSIIANSLTTQYLTWYWITNLDKFNSVIYIPTGQNGLPLFKNVDDVRIMNATG